MKLKLPSDVEVKCIFMELCFPPVLILSSVLTWQRYEILESLLKGKIHPDESVQDLLEDLTLATEEK